ncbi:hypothetical protein PIB30_117676 [Stylosanthes scabra]|uniref:Uncharacterized protein n=1 Tax=Stylosanthes scabra TaxID=79078 RepID=A0ABU6ZVU7_9FABA|nr:hypothetical protein [Stylosanthes scabra]
MSFSHHRRTQSELHFRIPDEFDLDLDVDVDFDVDFKNPLPNNEPLIPPGSDNQLPPLSPASATVPPIVDTSKTTVRPGHRRSNSADGPSSFSLLEGIEAKKAMSPDKLAELWTVDPKRAKRSLSLNRYSIFIFNCGFWQTVNPLPVQKRGELIMWWNLREKFILFKRKQLLFLPN